MFCRRAYHIIIAILNNVISIELRNLNIEQQFQREDHQLKKHVTSIKWEGKSHHQKSLTLSSALPNLR